MRTTIWAGAVVLAAGMAMAEPRLIEDFTDGPERRWDYVSDQVMGGVSEGGAAVSTDGARQFLRLTGDVSTANNGGFIQVRRKFSGGFPEGTEGLRAEVRGNDQGYFVHIRTTATRIPWHYYQAAFPAGADWQTVTLPLSAFTPSNRAVPARIDPEKITSIGFVAYGRDHQADLSVRSVSIY